jgi:hypothetical protein
MKLRTSCPPHFFLLKGMCLLSSIGKQGYVNSFAHMAVDPAPPITCKSGTKVGNKRSRIYIPDAAVQLSRSPRSIVLGPLVREQILIALFLTRWIFRPICIMKLIPDDFFSGSCVSQLFAPSFLKGTKEAHHF